MVLVMEPCGLWPGQGALINKNLAANLFRFNMTSHAALVIISSAVIGVAVSLTTFLAIAGTSTLTYSVVGHMKTLLVLLGALLGLGEEMPWKRGLGICAAFGGIVWYTLLVTLWREDVGPAERKTSKDDAEGDEKGGLAKRPGWQAQALLNGTGRKHTSKTTTAGLTSSPRFRVAVSPRCSSSPTSKVAGCGANHLPGDEERAPDECIPFGRQLYPEGARTFLV
ncbi:hypothetical protein QJQ45_022780 [Haematococcus lacustris]|nr:hypothetical protein QJQ45_022780 [Haematococcus lacustris]